MTIRWKLFTISTLTTLTVVLCMSILIRWSFERGLLEYVQERELQRQQSISYQLAEHYRDFNSWDALRSNPKLWANLVRRETRRIFRKNDKNLALQASRSFAKPIALLDENKEPIIRHRLVKRYLSDPNTTLIPITVDKRIVGYLTAHTSPALDQQLDLSFRQNQRGAIMVVGVLMALLTAGIAFPLSHYIVKPVSQISSLTRQLASGHYSTRTGIERSDELGDLARSIDRLAHTLETSETMRERLLADIAHELRTPLAILRGEIEAIQDDLRPCTKEQIASLGEEVNQLTRLVEDLRTLTLSDLGALDYTMATFDSIELIKEVVNQLAPIATENQIVISTQLPTHGCTLHADRFRLKQLIQNVLTNSIRYTHKEGKILVSLSSHKNGWRLIIEDSAPGVAPAALPELCNHLFRIETSRNRSKGGSGLGLAIAKRIVEAHHGHIEHDHSPLGGLKTKITIPHTG